MSSGGARSPVQEFESLWGKGQVPNVREFLQKTADLTPQQIVEVLCIDQWQRWQQGDRIPAETYLEMHPLLGSHPEAAFDLVYGEFLLRQECVSQDPHALRRFQQEAQAAAKLTHPNIIVIYDFNQVEGTYYIAMEYVEGVDLHQLVRDCGPLPVPLACHYARQVALGLQHPYKHRMVHRDIKPPNLSLALPSMELGLSRFNTF